MSTAELTYSGVLEMHPKGYGYLRDPARNFRVRNTDVYVGSPLLTRFQLKQGRPPDRPGDEARPRGEAPKLAELTEIEGRTPEQYLDLRPFDELTVIDPHDQIRLEAGAEPLGMRVMDLLTPIGKGQRGLIVAPPRSGKTILLQQMAAAVARTTPTCT